MLFQFFYYYYFLKNSVDDFYKTFRSLDLTHDKILKKYTSQFLLLLPILNIFFICLFTNFSKSVRENFQIVNDGEEFLATISFAYSNVFWLSPEGNKNISYFSTLFVLNFLFCFYEKETLLWTKNIKFVLKLINALSRFWFPKS